MSALGPDFHAGSSHRRELYMLYHVSNDQEREESGYGCCHEYDAGCFGILHHRTVEWKLGFCSLLLTSLPDAGQYSIIVMSMGSRLSRSESLLLSTVWQVS